MNKTKTILLSLIVLCILAMSGMFIGYSATYSRYIEYKRSENFSRIAVLGIEMTWSENAFLTEYVKGTPARVVVQSNEKTMAPSLSNNIVLSLRGKCETAFNLTINIDEIYSEHWKESGLTTALPYHPIKLTAHSAQIGSVNIVNNVISINYEAEGDNLVEDITITWEWQPDINNDADTYMSSLSHIATYSLSVEAIVTQIN